MFSVNVKCPHCGKSLMDKNKIIDGKPAIAVKITYGGKKSILYLSSVYGSYNIETDLDVPKSKIAGFRCIHCNADLKIERRCDLCRAQMVSFALVGGGKVSICSRRGCRKHVIEFEDPQKELEAFYRSYIKEYKDLK
jgi:ssDNA-binding Zn-finger/Zn-ribbon topoisomerase 1